MLDDEHFVKIFEYLASKSLASEASVKTETKSKPNTSPSPNPRPSPAPFDVQRLKDFKINGAIGAHGEKEDIVFKYLSIEG